MINGVKPRSHYRHYSNPSCQGTLIRQTAEWPIHPRKQPEKFYGSFLDAGYFLDGSWKERIDPNQESEPVPIPEGLKAGDAYIDRMWSWDRKKMERAVEHLSNGFDSSDEELIAFAKAYFDVAVVAVRTVYYYDVSSGYDCVRVDYLYRDGPIK